MIPSYLESQTTTHAKQLATFTTSTVVVAGFLNGSVDDVDPTTVPGFAASLFAAQ